MTLADFWAHALRRLHHELSEQQFNLAIAPITVGEEDGAWVIYAKNQFAINLLRSQYAAKIADLHSELAPNSPEIAYKVGKGESIDMAVESSLKTQKQPETTAEPVIHSKIIAEKTPSVSPSKKSSAQDILAQRMNNLRPAKKMDEDTTPAPSRSAIEEEREREEAEQRHMQTNLSPDYTFDTLVEGKGNQLGKPTWCKQWATNY